MRFDLIVIGTGAAGSPVARRCRSAGWNVAIVDARPDGGTCVQRGCDPKKVLVGAAEAVHAARRLLHLQTKVQGVARVADHLAITADGPQGTRTFEVDIVVHGAGRVPEIEDLDLEQGGVEHGKRGVRVNEYLPSVSNPAVYAAGDAADSGPDADAGRRLRGRPRAVCL